MVNRVILIGNLGADPEIKTLESGVSVARLRLATSESYKDKNTDEWKENTEWPSITLWRALAERAERTLKKGMQIYVEGKISTRKWTDQEGKERYTIAITILERIEEKVVNEAPTPFNSTDTAFTIYPELCDRK